MDYLENNKLVLARRNKQMDASSFNVLTLLFMVTLIRHDIGYLSCIHPFQSPKAHFGPSLWTSFSVKSGYLRHQV